MCPFSGSVLRQKIPSISISSAGRISGTSLLGAQPKVFQLIKTRSAPSNVVERVGELSIRGLLRELE